MLYKVKMKSFVAKSKKYLTFSLMIYQTDSEGLDWMTVWYALLMSLIHLLQEKIKRTRDENPELRYHEDNEEYLIRKTKKQYTLSIRWRNGRHVQLIFK